MIKSHDRQAAAVSMMQAAKLESGLQLFVNSFQQGINQCLKLHGVLMGGEMGAIALSSKFLTQSSDPNTLLVYAN